MAGERERERDADHVALIAAVTDNNKRRSAINAGISFRAAASLSLSVDIFSAALITLHLSSGTLVGQES